MTLLCGVLLLIACGIQYISFGNFTLFSALSLGVPILKIGCFIFGCYWILKRNRKAWVFSLGILVFSYFTLGPFVKWFGGKTDINENNLSVMSFNVMGFNKNMWWSDKTMGQRSINFLKDKKPDILSLQEFDYSKIHNGDFDFYPYSYVDFEYYQKKVISAIYSKYPIVNSGSLGFSDTNNNGIYADVLYKNDTIRVYNVHLESLKIRPKSFAKENSDRLYNRLGESFSKQQEQAEIVKKNINACRYKKIVCADLNNTQFSNVYKEIKGDLKDTFNEAGSGIGRTYLFAKFSLRIDFILVDERMEIKTHHNFDQRISDHFPVMASINTNSD